MPLDSDMARLRRPYTRYLRRLLNRSGLGALAGAIAGVIGATTSVAGGIWLLTFTGWSEGDLPGPPPSAAPHEVAGRGLAELASSAAEGGETLLAFAAIPFTLVGYGLVLGALLGLAHGLVVSREGRSGPLELVAAATGAAVGWQVAGPWLAAVPALSAHGGLATAVASLAAAIGAGVGGALFVALSGRPRRGDWIPED